MSSTVIVLSAVIAWTRSSPAPNCFNNFDNFDECWERVEEHCLNDDGQFEDCHIEDVKEEEHKHIQINPEHNDYKLSNHCYANLHVCLLDEYSSKQKCEAMAAQCYHHYQKEKCVLSIQSCLAKHEHNPQQCFGVADACLDKDADTDHGHCFSHVDTCFTGSGYEMEQCFDEISNCKDQHAKKTACMSEVKSCFQGSDQGFDNCFKLFVSCSHDQHEQISSDSCSDQMERCFDYKDSAACSTMFDICFHDDQHVEEEDHGDNSCLDNVRYCISHEDDHDNCYALMSNCIDDIDHKPPCSEKVITCIEHNPQNPGQCHHVIADCVENDEQYNARDCYDDIERCYAASHHDEDDVCSAFLPTCFAKKEDTKIQSCYIQIESCLLDNYVANDVCHENLKTCLGEGHHSNDYHDDESHGDRDQSCGQKIRICLTGDQALCYDHLQNYLNGYSCYEEGSQAGDDHGGDQDHGGDHDHIVGDDDHGYLVEEGNGEYWETIVSILLKKIWDAKRNNY